MNCLSCNNPMEDVESNVFGMVFKPTVCSDACQYAMSHEIAKKDWLRLSCTISDRVPQVFKGLKLSDFDDSFIITGNNKIKASDFLTRFIKSDYWFLGINSNGNGIGKTRLGFMALIELCKIGKFNTRDIETIQDAGYYKASEICRLMARERFDNYQPMHRYFSNVPILFIDDLGSEKKGGEEDISYILEKREEMQKKTILTANHNQKYIVERYGNRVMSRIQRGFFEMQGDDRR